MAEQRVEIRCPVGPKRLFMKLILEGERPHITSHNLMEFACADCRKTLAGRGDSVKRVLHRYNLLGDLVETVSEK